MIFSHIYIKIEKKYINLVFFNIENKEIFSTIIYMTSSSLKKKNILKEAACEKDDESFSQGSESENEVPLVKEKASKKEKINKKKIRSEKQQESFKKAFETRMNNIEKRKLEKKVEASKVLLENEFKFKEKEEVPKIKKVIKKVIEPESSSEEETIIVEKRKKKKKPKTKRIIVEESSESEGETDKEDSIDEQPPIKEKQFKSQQNKKSVIKVNGASRDMTVKKPVNFDSRNFFV